MKVTDAEREEILLAKDEFHGKWMYYHVTFKVPHLSQYRVQHGNHKREVAMAPWYGVTLTPQERKELEVLTRNGKSPEKKFIHARAALLCDASPEDLAFKVADVVTDLGVTSRTIEHLRRLLLRRPLKPLLSESRRWDRHGELFLAGRSKLGLLP